MFSIYTTDPIDPIYPMDPVDRIARIDRIDRVDQNTEPPKLMGKCKQDKAGSH